LPPSTNIEIRLERGGHDFELMQVQHYLKARPFSNLTSSAKKNFTTEPISMFVPGWLSRFIFETNLLGFNTLIRMMFLTMASIKQAELSKNKCR